MNTLITLIIAAATVHALAAEPSITLAVPDRANSTPWVAASGSFVAVAWGATAAGKGDIYLAVSRDGGATFGSPTRVNGVAGDARVSGEIAPRVSLLASQHGQALPIISVTWNAKDRGTEIKAAQSRDGGRTFTTQRSLQATGAPGDRGWQASGLDANGTLHTIWLDHRAMAIERAGPEHKGAHDGVAMAQRSGLYYAADGLPERELFKGVCYCCKTAMAIGPKGEIYGAWRHVFAGNMRDMAFTVSRDGGRTFSPLTRVREDQWSINGCPDDGPAMAVDRQGVVHLVWPTVIGGTEGALLYSTTMDGRTFTPAVRVPTLGGPKPSHPQIAIDGTGRVFVAWDEAVDGVRRPAFVTAARSSAGTPRFGTAQTIADTGAAIYPVMAAGARGMIAVWTSGAAPNQTVIRVRRLD